MADFKSYKQIVKWLSKGRNQSEGRRMRSIMFRLVGDTVVIAHCLRVWARSDTNPHATAWRLSDFAELRSDNTLTFTCDAADLRHVAASLSQVLHKVLGLCWDRKGKGRYNIFSWDGQRQRHYGQGFRDLRKGPNSHEHFNGMQWDMDTNMCLNPRSAIAKEVDRDARKVWMAQLKKFRRMFLTRVKLGIVDKIIEEYDPTIHTVKPDLSVSVDDAVLEAIKAGDVTNDLIELLVACRATTGWRPVVDRTTVCSLLNNIISRNSIQYRQEFGVLKK